MRHAANLYDTTRDERESAFGPVTMPVRFLDNGAPSSQEAREELHGEYHMLDLGALLDAQPAHELPEVLEDGDGFSPREMSRFDDVLAAGDAYGYFQHPVTGDVGPRAIGRAGADGFRAVIADRTFDDDVPADVIDSSTDRYASYVASRLRAADEGRDAAIVSAGKARLADICGAAVGLQKEALDDHLADIERNLGVLPAAPDRAAEQAGMEGPEAAGSDGGLTDLSQTELLHQAYLASLKLSQDGPDGVTENRYSDLMTELEDRSGMADLERENADLKRLKTEHAWSITGCTPDDVTEVYGDRFDITPEAAAEIAGRVNAAVSGIDDLFSDVLNEQVIAAAGEGEIAPAGTAEIAEGVEGACAPTAAADRAHTVQTDIGRG